MLSTLARLRTAAVVGVLGIAVTHIFELPDKLKESAVRYQGVLFIVLIVGCVLLAAVAARAPARPWWTGVLAVSVLPLISPIDVVARKREEVADVQPFGRRVREHHEGVIRTHA